MSSHSCKIHNLGISRLSLGNHRIKNHFNVILAMRFKIYYNEEGDGLLPSLGMWMSRIQTIPWPKVISIFANHLHCVVYVGDLSMRCLWMHYFVIIPILKAFAHLVCVEFGNIPPIYFSFYLIFVTTIWGFISQTLGKT